MLRVNSCNGLMSRVAGYVYIINGFATFYYPKSINSGGYLISEDLPLLFMNSHKEYVISVAHTILNEMNNHLSEDKWQKQNDKKIHQNIRI